MSFYWFVFCLFCVPREKGGIGTVQSGTTGTSVVLSSAEFLLDIVFVQKTENRLLKLL